MDRQRCERNSIVSLMIGAIFLVGCQTKADTNAPALTTFSDVSTSPLQQIGPKGGFLLVAIIDKNAYPEEQLPSVGEFPMVAGRTETQMKLGDQIRRSIVGGRINPAMEFGALYYLPARNSEESDGKVIQKLCATVDGHKLDEVVTTEQPTIYSRERRRLELSGNTDVELLSVFGISANAEAKYVFDIEVSDVRARQINLQDAKIMRSRLLAGSECRTKLLPKADGRRKFQLIAGLYGKIVVKQIFEVRGGVSVPQIKSELAIGSETESGRFMFFKVYDYELD
ncbi:hypothetical protein DFR52_106267 [Hoeflea marina]|uniref:Uncharacterized protein n=2 Tax=Hoeflea marina TaxID=274592 RepID=A0A317PFP2_9HYPH|nr:hypothetical protein DFR52_106267 [Hoeflea marina]